MPRYHQKSLSLLAILANSAGFMKRSWATRLHCALAYLWVDRPFCNASRRSRNLVGQTIVFRHLSAGFAGIDSGKINCGVLHVQSFMHQHFQEADNQDLAPASLRACATSVAGRRIAIWTLLFWFSFAKRLDPRL